jgi:hypothetical protein
VGWFRNFLQRSSNELESVFVSQRISLKNGRKKLKLLLQRKAGGQSVLGRFPCYISDILCACRMRDPRYAASRVKSRFCCSSAHPPPTMQPHCCVLIHWTFCGRSVFQQPINSTCMHSGCIVGCRLISTSFPLGIISERSE